MQDEIDARDIVSRDIALLRIEKRRFGCFVMAAQVFPALKQQRAGAAGPIADLMLLGRLDDFRHEVRNRLRRVELTRTLARFAGEGADQIFVGVAK